jgi:hypothetical protein
MFGPPDSSSIYYTSFCPVAWMVQSSEGNKIDRIKGSRALPPWGILIYLNRITLSNAERLPQLSGNDCAPLKSDLLTLGMHSNQ